MPSPRQRWDLYTQDVNCPIAGIFGTPGGSSFLDQRQVWTVVAVLVAAPLSLLKTMDALRVTSALAVPDHTPVPSLAVRLQRTLLAGALQNETACRLQTVPLPKTTCR